MHHHDNYVPFIRVIVIAYVAFGLVGDRLVRNGTPY